MSWNNPTQDEAANEYYSSKNRYNNAANQKNAAMRAAESCSAEKSQAVSAITSCRSDKINFEQRIEDIKMIIAVLEGSGGAGILGGVIGTSVPDAISAFNSTAQETDISYRESIHCSDIASTSIYDVFRSKSVEEDGNLSGALQKLKNEVARLEQAIRDIEAQINNLSNLIEELTSKINIYNAEQADCRRIMLSCAFEMNHFRMYM